MAAIATGKSRFVMGDATADTVKAPTAATDVPIGVRENACVTAGDSVDVVLFGLTHITLGATVAQWAHIQINGTDGKAKTLAATGYDAGVCHEGGDTGEIVKCFIDIIGIPMA
ncbi:hypothetical protein KAX02_05410 [candidate division WOR-3 bacterium]|nr:hypothetical protein [candidate division WOR-3 bacterium]